MWKINKLIRAIFINHACDFVHFASGSSAGTENDTCVSARIKIFTIFIFNLLQMINTKAMGWTKTFLIVIILSISLRGTSNYNFLVTRQFFPLKASLNAVFSCWISFNPLYSIHQMKLLKRSKYWIRVVIRFWLSAHTHTHLNWSPKIFCFQSQRLSLCYLYNILRFICLCQ